MTLHNFSPPATDDEIRASSLQFVRKLSGFTKPSRANEEAFNRAVNDVAHAAHHLLESLVTNAPPRDRATEAFKAKARSATRSGTARSVAAERTVLGCNPWLEEPNEHRHDSIIYLYRDASPECVAYRFGPIREVDHDSSRNRLHRRPAATL